MSEQELSKKERKEIKKQEQAAQNKRETEAKRAAKARKWTTVIITVVVIAGFLTWLTSAAPERVIPTDATPDVINEITEADNSKGASAETAKAVLVEYGDFQCPACGQYAPIVKQLAEDFSEDVQIVYRHLPLKNIHPLAETAAKYAEAAGRQGMFWEMHDLLFENQANWTTASRGRAESIFEGYAEELGLDVEQIKIDAADPTTDELVDANFLDAVSAGAQGTPSFFLNGEYIQSPGSYDEFAQILRVAIGAEAETVEVPENAGLPTLDGAIQGNNSN